MKTSISKTKDRLIMCSVVIPYCVLAQEAVRILRKNGFNAVRLEDGIAEWREAGLKGITGK